MLAEAGICRADNGCGYIGAKSSADVRNLAVSAHLAKDPSKELPYQLIELDLPSSRQAVAGPGADVRAWAVRIPLLGADVTVELDGTDGEHLKVDFPVLGSKLASRLLTKRQPAAAAALRHSEDTCWTGRTRLLLQGVWPSGDDVVLRWQAIFASGSAEAVPQLSAMDVQAAPVVLSPLIMEDHVVPAERDTHLLERVVTFSVRMHGVPSDLTFMASLEGEEGTEGFTCIRAAEIIQRLDASRALVAGPAADPAYEHWLDCHRSSWKDLEQQRQASEAGAGLPSLSMLLSVSADDVQERPDCVEMVLRSLKEQSMAGVERLVVCPPSMLGRLSAMDAASGLDLKGYEGDERAGICWGLQQVTGEYVVLCSVTATLEPDACWRFACAAADKQPALIYGDADCLRDGHFCDPSFKTFPNLARLWAGEYFGDAICIRCDVPGVVQWPSPDEGALRYDLELRVMEKRLPVVHVPRVLSHAILRREERERCKAALGQHLQRMGVAASVEDGPYPGSFRVRHALPEKQPLVSIVIPSKDQSVLLARCVRSIIEKSSYQNYEVIIVENNSTEPETFETYRRLG